MSPPQSRLVIPLVIFSASLAMTSVVARAASRSTPCQYIVIANPLAVVDEVGMATEDPTFGREMLLGSQDADTIQLEAEPATPNSMIFFTRVAEEGRLQPAVVNGIGVLPGCGNGNCPPLEEVDARGTWESSGCLIGGGASCTANAQLGDTSGTMSYKIGEAQEVTIYLRYSACAMSRTCTGD